MTGVIGRRRQRHERGYVRLHALANRRRLAAQDRLTPLDAGVEEPRVERVETVRDGQRRHEVAPDISDQPLDLALVVALARSAKAVVEQVMALEFREHLRAQALSALHDLGHREPGVVVQNRLRHAAEKIERRHMAVAEGFRRLGWIGLDEAAVRVRQIHAKVMKADLLARDIGVRLAKIRLRMPRAMAQGNEHLARAQHGPRHILPHDRVAAGKSFFIPQPFENPLRRVALLLVHAPVVFKDLVDPRHIRTKLLRRWPLAPPVARRNRILKHLRDRVAMNAKALRRLPAAQPVHHHRASYPGIEFHCEHPSGLSMPFKDIELA